MTRDCVILSCTLISLLAFSVPSFGMGTAPEVFGTPPPEGQTILEVATTRTYETVNEWLDPGVPVTSTIELPLPVFPSGPTALPSQCLWSVAFLGFDAIGEEPFDTPSTSLDISYTVDGGNLVVELEVPYYAHYSQDWTMWFCISAVAIRTEPPSPVESMSIGEIKAMFWEE
jgi:hypothetical protein